MRGNASGSTLRLTLGCLLSEELGNELRRVGKGERLTFGKSGETAPSEWMSYNAFVSWVVTERPWQTETTDIQTVPAVESFAEQPPRRDSAIFDARFRVAV